MVRQLLVLLAYLFILARVADTTSSSPPTEYEHRDIFNSLGWPFKSRFAQFLDEMCKEPNVPISEGCRLKLANFSHQLTTNDENASRVYDSFSRLKPGLLSNELTDLGHYHQCLTANIWSTRYVLLEVDMDEAGVSHLSEEIQQHISFQKPMVAVCIPAQCTESDVRIFLKSEKVTSTIFPFTLHLFTSEALEEDAFQAHQTLRYVSRAIIVFVISLSLIATVYCHLRPGQSALVTCFDLVTNSRAVFRRSTQDRTQIYNTLRGIYLMVAISGHIVSPMSPAIRPYHHSMLDTIIFSDQTTLKIAQLLGFVIAVNFLLSSSLSVMSWLPVFHARKGKVSFLSFIFIRASRVYAGIISFMMLVASFPWISSLGGPLMNHMQNTSINLLRTHGWKELLFISNFQTPSQLAIPVAWFISCDMQLYFASFIIIYYLYKKPSLGIFLASAQMFIGMALHYIYLHYNNVSPTMLITTKRLEGLEEFLEATHMHTSNYIAPYSVGLLFGYLIASNVSLPSRHHSKLLAVSSVVFFGALFTPWMYDSEGNTSCPRVLELIIGVTYKSLIVAGVGGFIYFSWLNPHLNNRLPWLNHCFTVLSRLSFCMFLVHPIQILFHISSKQDARHFDQSDVNALSLYISVTCFFYGFLLHVFAEAPLYRLTRVITAAKSTTDLKSTNQMSSNSQKDTTKNE